MALIEINKNPSPRELKAFALALGMLFAAVGLMILWKTGVAVAACAVWIIGPRLIAVYLALPATRRRIYVGWMCAMAPVGWLVSHAALAIVFFAVVVPIGLVMRLVGRDPMDRRRAPSAESYWLAHQTDETPGDNFRQF